MDAVIAGLAESVQDAVRWVAQLLTVWILVPSTDLCPTGGDWVTRCNTADFPAQQLRGYMLPLTILITVGGLIWQGITMTVTRKGEPLLQAVRGVWTTALWGGIGIAVTHAALEAGDSYSMWILNRAIFSDSARPPDETFSAAFGALLLPAHTVAPFVAMLLGIVAMFVAVLQIILMVFREGAVVILAGMLQLAAAGTITRTTSSWLQRVMGWTLAMVAYKPMAATVYAVAFMLMSSQDPNGGGRTFVVGLAVLGLSVVAMPALIKFFSWTTGSIASGGGGIGMFGAATTAALYAGAAVRVGGNSARDHASYLDSTLGAPASSTPTGASTSAVAGAVTRAGAAAGTSATAGASGAATGAAAGAATGTGVVAGAAATGPAAPIVLGAAAAAQAGSQAVKSGADAVTRTTQGADQ